MIDIVLMLAMLGFFYRLGRDDGIFEERHGLSTEEGGE